MKVPPVEIVFSESDKDAITQAIWDVLGTGRLTLGEHGRAFEEAFARYVGAKHAIAVNSGTSSLEIPLRAWGVEDAEVLVPTNTFFATPAAVLHAGARVKFVDMDPETFSLDVEDLQRKITPRTKAVVLVHIGGFVSPQAKAIREICDDRGIRLLEDAAHAHGSTAGGKQAGTFGHASSFSFYPTKVMTSGEGGMIVTDDDDLAKVARQYRDQGKAGFDNNFHVVLGYNWRMSEVHAIIGARHLTHLEEFIKGRQAAVHHYDRALRGIRGIEPMQAPRGTTSNYYKYIVRLDDGIDRAAVKRALKEKHQVICAGEVYETPCHVQPVFQRLGSPAGSLPNAERGCAQHICLPMFHRLSGEQIEHVAASLREVLG